MTEDRRPPDPPRDGDRPSPTFQVVDDVLYPTRDGDPSSPPGEGIRTTGKVLAVIGLLLCWFPLAGYLGLLGVALILVGDSKAKGHPARRFPTASVILGLMATTIAVAWSVLIARASCPHVYAFDGSQWRLEADMLSGSLFAGAESEDLARLDHVKDVEGRYRIRIANERQERDYIDQAQLVVVDHAAGLEALPTSEGRIALVGALRAPTAARDGKGRDLLPMLTAQDELTWRGVPDDHDPTASVEPRDVLEVTLPRGAPEENERSYLVLRARNTEVATDALYRYLGEMGPGLGALLHWAEQGESYPYRQRIADEVERLGVPLHVEVKTASGWRPLPSVQPLGPAAMRTLAIALPGTGLDQAVTVRFVAAPQFWEIDRVAIASEAGEAQARNLEAARALDRAGGDARPILATADARRMLLSEGDQVEMEFAVPAAATPGSERTVFIKMRGYYEVDIGGRGWINPVAVWRHRSAGDSLPRYLLRSLRKG